MDGHRVKSAILQMCRDFPANRRQSPYAGDRDAPYRRCAAVDLTAIETIPQLARHVA
jgi:hypothetical protein